MGFVNHCIRLFISFIQLSITSKLQYLRIGVVNLMWFGVAECLFTISTWNAAVALVVGQRMRWSCIAAFEHHSHHFAALVFI